MTGPEEYLAADLTIDAILGAGPTLVEALAGATEGPVEPAVEILAPVASQEVWAAGVTYLRSKVARMEESDQPDHYDLVYEAERPEIFFKASGPRVRGTAQPIGIRADSTWDVPEPELCLVIDHSGEVVGYAVGNDVTSRSIEGENPLYLPQAKSFDGSCAIGPCIVAAGEAPALASLEIDLTIDREGTTAYHDRVLVADLRRTPEELVSWLYRATGFPVGAFLLTGTAIVPPAGFTLHGGDVVTVSIEGIGTLRNGVEVVGAPPST
jgi:2-dehydro-3-deoxy-D-arabinonate dehydratase